MTLPARAAEFADRAARAHAAMERAFRRGDGMYRRDGVMARVGAVAHLWPYARAFVATLDLAGVDRALLGDLVPDGSTDAMLAVLERYWNPRPLPAYASDPPGGSRFGGDRYYDDNAWVALALIQRHRCATGAATPGLLARAAELWEFAQNGWDRSGAPPAGGVHWVEQGYGIGRRNHDRNTVSCAPNAQVGLHLADLGMTATASVTPGEMFTWVVEHLDAGGDGLGPFYDKLRGDGSLDETVWTYNQGSMIGAAVLFARLAMAAGHETAASEWIDRAAAIGRRSLAYFAGPALQAQPAEFNAIYFRNLLLLHHAIADAGLRDEITATISGYADWLWDGCRTAEDRFRFERRGFTLLGQSAAVQIYALLAWDPGEYARIA